jgi:hypothetical protein
MFRQTYNDNRYFHHIANVPGTDQYNHCFRIMRKEDINEEVKYATGNR